jgi:flagellar biosynthetic protein FliQ
MNGTQAIGVAEYAIYSMIKLSLPLMLTALAIGLIVSLFQALTQIQEQTLSFIPKIIAMLFVLLLLLPMAGEEMSRFTQYIFGLVISSGDF